MLAAELEYEAELASPVPVPGLPEPAAAPEAAGGQRGRGASPPRPLSAALGSGAPDLPPELAPRPLSASGATVAGGQRWALDVDAEGARAV